MKPHLLPTLALTGLACGAAAQDLPPGIPTPTHDWGCKVLLCLANPNGPTAEKACEPPIHRLWRELRRGRPFPTCAMVTGPNGRSYAVPGFQPYDPCPDGTTELASGQYAQLAASMTATPPVTRSGSPSTYRAGATGLMYAGIGDGSMPYAGETPPAKVCVAGLRDTRSLWLDETSYLVGVYDTVYVSPMQASPRVIDVYVDDSLWHRVRW